MTRRDCSKAFTWLQEMLSAGPWALSSKISPRECLLLTPVSWAAHQGPARPRPGPRLGFTAQFSAPGSFTPSSISSRMIEPDRHDNITTQPSATPNTGLIKLLTWHPLYYGQWLDWIWNSKKNAGWNHLCFFSVFSCIEETPEVPKSVSVSKQISIQWCL